MKYVPWLRVSFSCVGLLVCITLLFLTAEWGRAAQSPNAAGQIPIADSPLLDSLLHAVPALRKVADNPRYELQIIYTQINRDAKNQPHFTPYYYHVNPQRYFNPASLVKLPVAALALEKLNALKISRQTIMATGTAFRCQTSVPFAASTDPDQWTTPANYIKRMLLVSDNAAYNRLYEFLGQRPLNERLAQLGYSTARITRRFAPCDTAANRHTNPITFLTSKRDTVYKQPAQTNTHAYTSPLGRVMKGRAYQSGGRIINAPYDFTTANFLTLPDVTDLLQRLLFPATGTKRLNLTSDDYSFLRRYLYATPHESGFTLYKPDRYFDAYKKYFYYGRRAEAVAIPSLRIYNVVGMSHGFLADVSYFADQANQIEFMLSAVLYVNADGIINDGAYEYESIGLPFLALLGQQVHQFEVQRARPFKPDLTELFAPEAAR